MSDTNPLQDCFSQSNHDVNGRRDEYRPFKQQVAFNHYLSVDNNSGDHSDNEALLKARLARADQRIQESLNREQVTGFEKAFYRANELLMIEERKDFASMDKDAAALAQRQTDLGVFQQWTKGFSDDLQALLYRYYCYYYKVQGRDDAQAFLQLLQRDQAIDSEDKLFLDTFLAAFSFVYRQIITLAYRLLVWFEGRERAEQFFKQAPHTQQTKSFESVSERYVFEVGDLMDVLYSHPYLLRNRSKKRDLMKGKCTTQVSLKNSVVDSQFVQFDLLDIARVYCELQGISLPQGSNDLVIIRELMDVKVWERELNEALLKARLAWADQRIQEFLNREQVTGFEKAFYRANELLMIEKRKDFASMDKDAAALAQWQTDLGIFQQWAKGFSDDLQALLYRYYCYYYKVQGRDAAQAFLRLLQQDQAIDLEDQLFLNVFLAAFSPAYQQIITLAYRLLVWFEGRERAEQFFKQAPRTQQTKSFESVSERYVFEVGDLMDVLYSHPYLLRNRSKKRDLMKGKCTTQVSLKNSVVDSQFVQFDLLDIARVYCELQGISLPQGGNDLVIIRKLMDVKVWGRKLAVKNRRLREKNHQARIGRGGELYLSNNSYEEYQERKKGEQAFIENQVLVSDQGDELLLADAVKSSINNPDHRFTEFMIRAVSLEGFVQGSGDYVGVFVTLTTPSKYKPKRVLSANAYHEQFYDYHYGINVCESDFLANPIYQANHHKKFMFEGKPLYSVIGNLHGNIYSFTETKGKDKGETKYVAPNLNYQPTVVKLNKKVVRRTETAADKKLYQVVDNSPRIAHDHLIATVAKMRTDFKNEGVSWFGYRVTEATHDGIPHLHLGLYVHRDQVETLERIIRDRALEVDGKEKGAERYRVDIKRLDMNEYVLDENGKPTEKKNSVAAYVAKYVGKAVSDERVLAWKGLYGMRQFDFYGVAPIGVYRELRRVKQPLDNPRAEAVRLAADKGDWSGFTKALMNCSMAYRHEVVRDSSGQVICNDYGEPKKRLSGLDYEDKESGASGFILTRDRVWFAVNLNALEQRMIDGLPQDEQENTRHLDRIADLKARAIEKKKVSKLFFGMGGVAPASFLAAVGASSPPWFKFNGDYCVKKNQAKNSHPSSNHQIKPPD